MSAPSSAAPGECADGDGARGFVDLLARERREFNLPSRLLVEALALPGSHASEREVIADRFLAELPAIREALLLDAHAVSRAIPPHTASTR